MLAGDPNRRNLRDLAAFFEPQLARLGVEMMLGNKVAADEMIAFAPMLWWSPPVAGSWFRTYPGSGTRMSGKLSTSSPGRPWAVPRWSWGDSTIIWPDRRSPSFSLIEGCTVELISEQFDFAGGVEDGTRFVVMQRLLKKGVTVSLLHRLVAVDAGGAVVSGTFGRTGASAWRE